MAPMMLAPCDAKAEATPLQRGAPHERVTDHALAPAHLDPAGLELGLYQHHDLGAEPGQGAGEHRGHGAQRDEREVGRDHVERGPPHRGELECPDVGAFQHLDPAVLAQRRIELTVPDVHRDHHGGTPAQQTVGEAPRGRAGVEASTTGHLHAEAVQRGFELVSATRHEAAGVDVDDDDRIGLGHETGRLVRT